MRQNCAQLKAQKIGLACCVDPQRVSPQTSKNLHSANFFIHFLICFHFKLTIDAFSMFSHLTKVLGVIETMIWQYFTRVTVKFFLETVPNINLDPNNNLETHPSNLSA